MRICSHLLNKFLTEKFIFCALICASKQTENYCEEENNLFFEKLCCFFIHIFRKSLCNLQIFYRSVFRCKVLRPFVFYLFEVQSTVLVSSSSQGENVLIQQLFLTREGKKLCVIFAKSQKLCLHKICNIDSTTIVNSCEFRVFILNLKCAELHYCEKNIHFTIF